MEPIQHCIRYSSIIFILLGCKPCRDKDIIHLFIILSLRQILYVKIKVVGRKSRVFGVRHPWILLLVLLHSLLQGLVLLHQKIYFPVKVILRIKLGVIKYLPKHGPTSTQKSLLKAHSLFLSSSQALRIPISFAGICGQCPLSLDMRLSLWLSKDRQIKIHSNKLPFRMIHAIQISQKGN